MAKPRIKKLYAVVNQRGTIEALEMYDDPDVKIEDGESLWIVEVKPVKLLKTKRKKRKL